ncbi:unnamed protein product, partial [Trichogramma brassicae]
MKKPTRRCAAAAVAQPKFQAYTESSYLGIFKEKTRKEKPRRPLVDTRKNAQSSARDDDSSRARHSRMTIDACDSRATSREEEKKRLLKVLTYTRLELNQLHSSLQLRNSTRKFFKNKTCLPRTHMIREYEENRETDINDEMEIEFECVDVKLTVDLLCTMVSDMHVVFAARNSQARIFSSNTSIWRTMVLSSIAVKHV